MATPFGERITREGGVVGEPQAPGSWRLQLLGEFVAERDGERIETPGCVSRVLACLALQGPVLGREQLARLLWPRLSGTRAAGSLRSALWRMRQLDVDAVEPCRTTIRLAPTVSVDVHELMRDAHRCIGGGAGTTGIDERLGVDLLPDWPDDWLIGPREQVRRLRIQALESLCAVLTGQGRTGEAIDVAFSAVSADPLREGPRRLLISAHLAEGNRVEALRAYAAYRGLILSELDREPSSGLATLAHQRHPAW